VIALALAPSLVKESRSSERVKLDLTGALLVTAAVVLLVYPVIQGRDAGWPAWTWISMVGSLPVFALFALFAWWQHVRKRGGGTPLVELRLFLQRAFSVGLVVSLLFWTAIAFVFLVLTIFLQTGWNYTPLHAGLTFLPLAGASVIGSGIAVPLAPKIGRVVVQIGGLIFFGQLANRSDEATAAGVPKLRHELQVAGLPAPAIDGVVTGFRTCYHDIAHAKDPTQTPASCRQMTGGTDPQVARIVTAAVNKVRPEVQRRDFTDSLVPSMYYQIAVFACTFLLVFFLPRRTSGEMHGH
jgi:multisubunit Na+/H+ antiporter MnhB subunit